MTSPIIKVYLTDAQFQELKQDLLDKFSIDLVNNLIDERIQQEQAPLRSKLLKKIYYTTVLTYLYIKFVFQKIKTPHHLPLIQALERNDIT